ncbi:MAG: hypothetical protein U0984_03655, partial [Prosthecobacter sp.]|nr:hypothetical protein [Prosthecobacter sp.]
MQPILPAPLLCDLCFFASLRHNPNAPRPIPPRALHQPTDHCPPPTDHTAMLPLPDPRHELFVRALASGCNVALAYHQA